MTPIYELQQYELFVRTNRYDKKMYIRLSAPQIPDSRGIVMVGVVAEKVKGSWVVLPPGATTTMHETNMVKKISSLINVN